MVQTDCSNCILLLKYMSDFQLWPPSQCVLNCLKKKNTFLLFAKLSGSTYFIIDTLCSLSSPLLKSLLYFRLVGEYHIVSFFFCAFVSPSVSAVLCWSLHIFRVSVYTLTLNLLIKHCALVGDHCALKWRIATASTWWLSSLVQVTPCLQMDMSRKRTGI